MSDSELIARIEGDVGRLTLNRPKALNALTTGMCVAVSEALLAWQDDPAVRLVLIDHAGERGFCAGGDIRQIQESGAGDGAAARAFFTHEYRMNELLHRYAKPVVAVVDGITMGGGVGISMPARYRIATERTLFAMPEADIGLFPDVGAGWYLPRLPGKTGTWLALTAGRLRSADCMALGITTHFVESTRTEAFKAALVGGRDLEAALAEFGGQAGEPPIAPLRADMDRLFAPESAEGILAALAADGSEWALAQRETMLKKCPATLKVSLRLIDYGARRRDFADEMACEYRVATRMCHRHDFLEGVRALIIDKDNSPRWEPATLAEVDEDLLDAIFAELPSDEEWTPFPTLA